MDYKDFHTNPINKLIHFFCIPLIVITTMSIIKYIKIPIINKKNYYCNLYEFIITLFLINYLLNYSLLDFILMVLYYSFCDFISFKWRQRKFWLAECIVFFILSWIAQFIGHYIEGNRPALLFSLSTAVFQAPLFSIKIFTL
tara:strand:+ start:1593 stop:2018 length:426 start_codon:yes stop_codon:yes gene_type:complete